MKTDPRKIDSVISEKRIKLHVFSPSNRKIWTVVGKEKEYWLDPDLDFCSCESYYFNKSAGKKDCYHLESIRLSKEKDQFEIIDFDDEEFEDFISGLITDL